MLQPFYQQGQVSLFSTLLNMGIHYSIRGGTFAMDHSKVVREAIEKLLISGIVGEVSKRCSGREFVF
jgi:hypothetical protein